MKKYVAAASNPGLLSLLAGAVFCVLLFTYGVTQEVPIGQIDGTILLAETGKPMPEAQVSLSVRGDDDARDRIVTSDTRGHFRFRNVRACDYEIHVFAMEHSTKVHLVTVPEGRRLHLDLKLAPNDPYLRLYASQRVWAPGDTPQVELHGFRAGDSIEVEIDRLNIPRLLAEGNFSKAVKALRIQGEGFNVPKSLDPYSIREIVLRHKVGNRDSEGAFVEPLSLPAMPEGFYWVKCRGKGAKAAAYINVSNLSLVTKTAHGRALAYACNLVSGKPVAGVKVWTQVSPTQVGTATTDSNGLAETRYGATPESEDANAGFLAVDGKSTALVGVYTTDDSEDSGHAKFVMYTDRPIYRPGDDVQFKGIVRLQSGMKYLPPRSGKVEVQINDTDDQPIQKIILPVDVHGSFSGHFATSKEAGPGLYRIVAKGFDSRGSHFVHMAAYRKPEMLVQVKSVQPYYFVGDVAQARIKCSYYFGAPVVGAKLQVNVFVAPTVEFDPDDQGDPNQTPSYEGGDLSKSIQAVTDAKGEAIIEFPTKTANDTTPRLEDLQFGVDVNASDASDKYVQGVGSVRVVRGDYGLSATCEQYLASLGQSVDVLVRTRSNDAGRNPVPGRSVTVEALAMAWKNGETREYPIATYRTVTGADGVVHVSVKAKVGGTIVVKAYSRDDSGRLIAARDQVFVMGGKWSAEADESRFEVILDRRRYKLGDTAHVVLRTVAPGGSALVTVQTDRLLWKKVVPLSQSATLIDLPVSADFMPNCFVNVAYVHKKRFYEGSTRLMVEPGVQKLKVSVSSDQAAFEPGGTARLTIRTADAAGRPTPADVSLGVVDESVYAIREDDFDIFEAFYPKRTNAVTTSYSFSEVYLDGGDKGGADVVVRRNFRDTAAWIPNIETDQTGSASVNVKLPDNLGEWRATAIAANAATSVGKGTVQFKARKKLMVRLEMPEFLVQQDDRQMSVMITNDTGADRDVHLLLAAKGVTVLGDLRQTVHVGIDQPVAVTFQLKTGNPGRAAITAKAWIDGGDSDGVEQGFPILAHGTSVREAWADQFPDAKDFDFQVPASIDRSTGRLKINLSSSLAGNLVASLNDLIGFPYGCVEQTMSRFMPSILVAKTVRDLGAPQPRLEKMIPKIAADSMIRLGRMQHEDGGWGWWEHDSSDPFMTALVLDGMARCKMAGFPIRKVNLPKAILWCRRRIHAKDWSTDSLRSRSYVVYVLARYGKSADAAAAYKEFKLKDASAAERATLVLAMNALGDKYKSERDRLMDRLAEQVHQGPLGAYWDSSDNDWGTESTALGLTAYMEVRPTDPLVPRIVRYLMSHRRGDIWDSTRDTSYSLVGLAEYLAKSHELSGHFVVKVYLNGRLVRAAHLEGKNPDAEAEVMEIPMSEIHPGPNTVRVEKAGTGTCYAALDLQATEIKQNLSADEPIPGFRVTRKYFRMETRRLEDGSLALLPSKRPVTSVESGDVLRVELTIQSNKKRQFVMVEDPIPSNCRVTDREELDEGEEWSFWWDRFVIRDEKVAFFVRNLTEGTQTMSYTMRAEGLGTAHALPPSMSNMYDLSERASGAESLLVVK